MLFLFIYFLGVLFPSSVPAPRNTRPFSSALWEEGGWLGGSPIISSLSPGYAIDSLSSPLRLPSSLSLLFSFISSVVAQYFSLIYLFLFISFLFLVSSLSRPLHSFFFALSLLKWFHNSLISQFNFLCLAFPLHCVGFFFFLFFF